jgi:hypothetical protein
MTTNLILVHLNTQVPRYLWENIASLKHLFPEVAKIIIISDGIELQSGSSDTKIHRVNSHQYDEVFDHAQHEMEFRHGFWRTSIERLLHLCDLICQQQLENTLHIESDILLFKRFPFSDFRNLSKIYWQEYNSERDVASILYIRNAIDAAWLKQELINQIVSDPYVTDMTALNRIRKGFPERVGVLTSINATNFDLKNKKYTHEYSDLSYSGAFKTGIYDSAQIGMWLLGMDPRNTYGLEILHSDLIIENGEGLLDPRRARYGFNDDNQMFACVGEIELPVLSIHVHSKAPDFFKVDNKMLQEYVNLAKNPLEIRKFRVGIFWLMFLDSVRSKRVINFMFGIPAIYRFRLAARNMLSK